MFRIVGGALDEGSREYALLWLLSLADGDHDLVDVAERSGLPLADVLASARLLRSACLWRDASRSTSPRLGSAGNMLITAAAVAFPSRMASPAGNPSASPAISPEANVSPAPSVFTGRHDTAGTCTTSSPASVMAPSGPRVITTSHGPCAAAARSMLTWSVRFIRSPVSKQTETSPARLSTSSQYRRMSSSHGRYPRSATTGTPERPSPSSTGSNPGNPGHKRIADPLERA